MGVTGQSSITAAASEQILFLLLQQCKIIDKISPPPKKRKGVHVLHKKNTFPSFSRQIQRSSQIMLHLRSHKSTAIKFGCGKIDINKDLQRRRCGKNIWGRELCGFMLFNALSNPQRSSFFFLSFNGFAELCISNTLLGNVVQSR